MGGPVVDVAFTTSGPDVPLSVRLWDVEEDGSLELTLPLLEPPGTTPGASPGDDASDPAPPRDERPPLPATGSPFGVAGFLLGALAVAVAVSAWRRPHRRRAR